MKKYIYIILIGILTLSCADDFLEECDKDKIIPKTVAEYSELLYGEAYLKDKMVGFYTRYMSDDIISGGKKPKFSFIKTDKRINVAGYYNWQPVPEYTTNYTINTDYDWYNLYHSILICNIVLDAVNNADGSDEEKYQLEAEARFVRAFDYFMLVNLYGEPYVDGSEMGVPINDLIGMEDIRFTRSSTGKVYSKIKTDLDRAISLFGKVSIEPSVFKGNLKASLLLASRVALYTKKWDDCIDYADELIKLSPTLYNLPEDYVAKTPFISRRNPEILYTYGDFFDGNLKQSVKYYFLHSPELYGLVNKFGDMRKSAFFLTTGSLWTGKTTVINKSDKPDLTGIYGYAFRTAEAYLNRAEAYAENGEILNCLKDLKTLRSNRFSIETEINASTKEEALSLARLERRIELCYEGHRWFDLRRQGCPRIEHKYMVECDPVTYVTYVLEENDAAYTLPLPLAVSEMETKMKNINRSTRNPINE